MIFKILSQILIVSLYYSDYYHNNKSHLVQGFILPNHITFQTHTNHKIRHSKIYYKKHITNEESVQKQQILSEFTLANPPDEPSLQNLKKGTRILSFGDIHGDSTALYNLLLLSNVIDAKSTIWNPIWNAECRNTIIVQCGDILDRYHQELECIRILCMLSHQALEYDSSIICLLGNHEVKNCLGGFEYTTPHGNAEFETVFGEYLDTTFKKKWRVQYANNEPCRWNVCEPGIGILSLNVLSKMKVALVVGNSLFVHAGLTRQHLLHYNNSISNMNVAAYEWITSLHHNETSQEYESIDHLLASVQRRMNNAIDNLPSCISGGIGSASPIWMRDYSKPANVEPSPAKQRMIDDALGMVGAKRMVMGHTPQSCINVALKGKAFRIDVGVSRGVRSGKPEVLEIVHNGEGEDSIHILTMDGDRIPASDRQVLDFDF